MCDMGSCPRGKPPRRAVLETRTGSAGLRDERVFSVFRAGVMR